MKKIVIGLLTIICITIVILTGCSSEDKHNPKFTYGHNPQFTYGALTGNQTIESVFNLIGETTSLPAISDFTNWGSASGKIITNQYSSTSDGGVVIWGDNRKYIYSSDESDLEELKMEFIKIATKDFTENSKKQ